MLFGLFLKTQVYHVDAFVPSQRRHTDIHIFRVLAVFSLLFVEAHLFRQTQTSTCQTSSGPELQFLVSDISLWELLFQVILISERTWWNFKQAAESLVLLFIYTLYCFHTGICSCEKRTVVRCCTVVEEKLEMSLDCVCACSSFPFLIAWCFKVLAS